MNSKIIGGVLLIVGTSIGGGMLALPMATAAGGFWHSTVLFLAAWFVTVLAAFYILEVNLWLPEGANLVSMAKATLGKSGQVVTWVAYLLLLYSLLAAYTAGGSDLLQHLLGLVNISLPDSLNVFLFVLILGWVLFSGVRAVDWANRSLMSIKLAAYVLLVVLIAPHVDAQKLMAGRFALLSGSLMVVMTSFGYATIIPSLRTYFKGDVKTLRLTIMVGSLIPLLCYLLWDWVVQGTIARDGTEGLVAMAHSPHAVSHLTDALRVTMNSFLVNDLTHLFTTICVTTSFLGVSLCLSDFLSDGLHIEKKGLGRWVVTVLVLLPPSVMVLFYPSLFIMGLHYAGLFCVILLMLLPGLMVWSGRYCKKISNGYKVMGGRFWVAIEILLSLFLLCFVLLGRGL